MKVVWAAAAIADLQDISDFIAAADPSRAVSFVERIVAAGEAIGDMPRA